MKGDSIMEYLLEEYGDVIICITDVSYEYYDAAADYDYYRLNIKYPVKSRLFGLNKLCDYKALVRVEMAV